MLSLLRLERKQKNYSNPFRICLFLFLSYSFGIEAMNTFIHSVVPYKTISDSRLKWAKCLPVFRPNSAKTLPDGAAHSHMAYIWEYSPGVCDNLWTDTNWHPPRPRDVTLFFLLTSPCTVIKLPSPENTRL